LKLDLKNLTKEQKIQLFQLLEEKERRQREQRSVYKPNPGQSRVHSSTARVRAVFAGNGSGKTALAANEAIWGMEGFNPVTQELKQVPARGIIVLDHPEKSETGWVPELQKWMNLKPENLHKSGKHHVSKITNTLGSELLFFSHSQDPLAFESIEADFVIFDEPPPRHIYVALIRGLRKKGRKPWVLIVGTPISQAWMRQEILEPWQDGKLEDHECFTYGTEVNEDNLADGYIETYGKALSPKERLIRFQGQFFDLDGLALKHLYNPLVHEVTPFKWPETNPTVVAIDPHTAKPHHAVLLGCDKDGYLYYIKELKLKAVARDFAKELRNWYRGYRVIDIVCDSLGSSEYTSGEGFKSFIQVLNEEGVRARATTWDEKSDEDFIQRIQDALVIPEEPNNFGQKIPKLRIFAGNIGIITDICNVAWTKFKNLDEFKPKLEISNRDFISCLKYALSTNLSLSKDKPKVFRREMPEKYVGKSRSPFKLSIGNRRR
jgi:hypothetical protein